MWKIFENRQNGCNVELWKTPRRSRGSPKNTPGFRKYAVELAKQD